MCIQLFPSRPIRKRVGLLLFLLLVPLCAQAPQCDLNSDGVVNVADVQIVLQAALGTPCAAIQPARDIFTSAPFTLSFLPADNGPTAMVYWNGLLQVPGIDYAIVGQSLAFISSDLGDSPVVQVVYWH